MFGTRRKILFMQQTKKNKSKRLPATFAANKFHNHLFYEHNQLGTRRSNRRHLHITYAQRRPSNSNVNGSWAQERTVGATTRPIKRNLHAKEMRKESKGFWGCHFLKFPFILQKLKSLT